MLRTLFASFAMLILAGSVSAKEVKIFWHGQSFFEIRTSGGSTIAIDPHFIEAYGRREVKADIVLITHFHIDHASPEPIVNFEKGLKDGKIKAFAALKNPKGVSGSRMQDEFNEMDEKIKDVRLITVGTYHDDQQGLKRGKNGVFVVEVDGLRICHLGDLAHTLSEQQIKKIGKVDILMIPVGGSYTINGSEAKKVVAQLKPTRYVIPMHYGTKVYDDLVTAEEFLDEQKEGTVKNYKFNELIVDTEAAVPKDPIIAVLNYEPKDKPVEEKPKDK